MDDLLKVPMEIAALLAGGTAAVMSGLKSLLKGKGKSIPTTWKVPAVGVIAVLGSMMWFQSKNSLSWSNWVDILAVTAMTMFIAVLWHGGQKGRSRGR